MNPVVTIIVRHGEDPYGDGPSLDYVSGWLNPMGAATELSELNEKAKKAPRWPAGHCHYSSFTVELKDA